MGIVLSIKYKFIALFLGISGLIFGYTLHDSKIDNAIKYKLDLHDNEIGNYYESLLNIQLRQDLQVSDGSVVMIGDSHTQGIIYPRFINYGIGSDTTFGVINRINKYDSLKNAKHVVLMIGVNDLRRRSNAEIEENYIKILSMVPNEKLIVFSVLPVGKMLESKNSKISNLRIMQLNKKISLICKNKGIRYIDIYASYINEHGYLDDKLHVGDGIHLNEFGYQIWKKHLDKISS
jgi:lysophospholipase L1-like esterase